MSERIVDTRGLLCPKPLILTKEAITESVPGQTIIVLTDNETVCKNIERFLVDQRMPSQVERKEGAFTLRFHKKSEEAEAQSCEAVSLKRRVIVIRSNRMGDGPSELGEILLNAFLNTIGEVLPLPTTIVFYNSGIHMTRKGSACLDALGTLHSKGVPLLVCGTCVDYFQAREEIEVGVICNMYTILQALMAADSILVP
jgi:selenium metabolism protein YedF